MNAPSFTQFATQFTRKCLNIGTLKAITFPFVPNVKLIILGVPKLGHITALLCSNIGTPKITNFPFGTNGKLMVLGVPIFKHCRVNWHAEAKVLKCLGILSGGATLLFSFLPSPTHPKGQTGQDLLYMATSSWLYKEMVSKCTIFLRL